MTEGVRTLSELAAVAARREGRASAALLELADQVELHVGDARERLDAARDGMRALAARQGRDQGPAAKRALELDLHARSLQTSIGRAAKAHAVATSFHLVCLVVVALSELVVLLFLALERGRFGGSLDQPGTVLVWALAAQFALLPFCLRWLERKLVWETYDDVLVELESTLEGVERQLARGSA